MKIDFLISSMEAGGAQRVVSIVANYLWARGHSVRVITFRGPDHYKLQEGIKRVRLHRQPIISSVVLNGFFSLLAYYRKKSNRPDIISSHVDLLGYVAIPSAKVYNIPIVISEHNNHLANNNLAQKLLWNYLYPLADKVTILTKFDYEFFLKRNKNTVIVPNPCPFIPISADPPKRNENYEIVAIGSLDRYLHKGFDNLILIAKKVFKNHPSWKLRIIGAGDTGLKFLQQQVDRLNLNDNVIFAGYQSNIKEILSNTDIFILSSRFEGLPMVLLEAMSQGAACISYDCISGPGDIITHNHDGMLIEDQNIDAMVAGLNELINNDSLRQKFQMNAPRSLEKFSVENIGKMWEDMFLEVKLSP
jgi:glycosyltransferase involved in cell wall biosynthesis